MSEANGNLIRTVNGDLIRHDGVPVLRQHFDNMPVNMSPQRGIIRMHSRS
ncbi:hypothetical protein [Paenirhodobacter populi]|nr:hypothetical protein [Sinirhodobacter populi]